MTVIVALVSLVALHLVVQPVAGNADLWRQLYDDLNDYRELTSSVVGNSAACFLSAENSTDAVKFDEATRVCRQFACLKGPFGCRNCRNVRNESLPSLWTRLSAESLRTCWKSFQHRADSSVLFNRTWSEYVSGFGQNEARNFWLGLEPLHQLTKDGGCRVRWEFSDWDDNWYWSENANFSVAGSADKFRARMSNADAARSNVPQYDASHAWSINNNQFSTPDVNNGIGPVDCAKFRFAGWWFNYCNFFNPNGVYINPPFPASVDSGLYYLYPGSNSPFSVYYSMRTVECLLEVPVDS